jgi:hypothetical protein
MVQAHNQVRSRRKGWVARNYVFVNGFEDRIEAFEAELAERFKQANSN